MRELVTYPKITEYKQKIWNLNSRLFDNGNRLFIIFFFFNFILEIDF